MQKTEGLIHVGCPCCRNKRLFDLEPESYGNIVIGIKCPICRAVVAVTIKNRELRTEQIAAHI